MNLSIEDLEAIKAIVRKTVREELERVMHQETKVQASVPQTQPQLDDASRPTEQEHPAEVVARIRRN